MMRILLCLFAFVYAATNVAQQTNPYFVEEEYIIDELSGHWVRDYYHSDDMYIYALSSSDSSRHLTKIDTAGVVEWQVNLQVDDLTTLHYDRIDRRVVLTSPSEVRVYGTSGQYLNGYERPDSLSIVASNNGLEYFCKLDVEETSRGADYMLQLYTMGTSQSPQLLVTHLMSHIPDARDPYMRLQRNSQYGDDYFDLKINFGFFGGGSDSPFRQAYIRCNWAGDISKSTITGGSDDPNGGITSYESKFLHSGRTAEYTITSPFDDRVVGNIIGCPINFNYVGYEFGYFQAGELKENVLLFGVSRVSNCGGALEVDEHIDYNNYYNYAIDHRGVMYSLSRSRIIFLKWIYRDDDGDGFSPLVDDCDDSDPDINPSAQEIYNNAIDENCDGIAEQDLDLDGYGQLTDCNDLDSLISPGALEIAYDGIDNDCDTLTLDDDLDEDGYFLADDCNDLDSTIYPGALEVVYDGFDNDCDTLTLDDDLDQDGYVLDDDCDDSDESVNPNAIEIFNNAVDENCDGIAEQDLDNDGYGELTDCNDQDSTIYPGALEVAYDGLDNDCDTLTLDDDVDLDGFLLADDCDDTNPAIYPGAVEIPNNGIDEDCDGEDLVTTSTVDIALLEVIVSPNPFSGLIQIDNPQGEDMSLRLYDIYGQLIVTRQIAGERRMDMSTRGLASGVYLLQMISRDGSKRVVKLVKG